MYCPVDRTVELITISVEGINIEHCRQCNGHWLHHGELAILSAKQESVEPAVSVARDSTRHCPEDHTPLTEVEFPEHSGLRVDICPQCKGIWLDANELGQALTLLGRQPNDVPSGPTRPVLDLLVRLTGGHKSS